MKNNKKDLHPKTLSVHSVLDHKESSGDVAQAIHLSTTFEHGPAYELINGFSYGRDNNPNVASFERALATLEGGSAAIAFASGVAAGAAILQTLPKGARVLFHHDTYLDFKNLVATYFERWSLNAIFVNMTDLKKVEAAFIGPIDLVWFETPSNPQLDVIDIRSVCAIANNHNVSVLVDSTFATPVLQKPLDLGADIVLQSTTKYIGGHSDTMGGALILHKNAPAEQEKSIRMVRKLTGGVMAPFSAWLAARGLQTLFCRVESQCDTALKIARFLETHPGVEKVHYPGLESDAGYHIAKAQMKKGGALVSFQVKEDQVKEDQVKGDMKTITHSAITDKAIGVAGRTKIFKTATSIGGVESLIEHRASVEGDATNTPKGLLRASIGLEHVDDLIADLDQALKG